VWELTQSFAPSQHVTSHLNSTALTFPATTFTIQSLRDFQTFSSVCFELLLALGKILSCVEKGRRRIAVDLDKNESFCLFLHRFLA